MAVQYVRCGPFVIAFHRGNKGDHFVARMEEPMDRKDAIYRGMLVRGHMRSIQVPKGAIPTPDYEAGMTSDQRPPITHAGRYVLEVTQDDSLFLCLQRKNKLSQWQRFSYEWLKQEHGSYDVKQGRVLVIGEGVITESQNPTPIAGPYVLWARTRPLTYTVVEPIKGIVVWAYSES